MTYPFEHYLIVWGGSMPGGDIWSCSLRFGDSVGLAVADEESPLFLYSGQKQVDGWVAAAIKAYHARPETRIHSNCKLNFIKSNRIGADGKYTNPGSPNTRIFPDIAGGLGGVAQPPNQQTLAVTLTTAMSRGRASKGRFYLPLSVMTVNSEGHVAANQCIEVAESTKTFIEALSDVPGIDVPISPEVQVMSRVGAGSANTVTGVRVGDVLDTQRRRRNKLREVYKAQAVDLGEF